MTRHGEILDQDVETQEMIENLLLNESDSVTTQRAREIEVGG